ncbi:hypothetical protein [Rhizobium sp. SAFR-030]|uniref:hypothetical protein n=1 Tax=Rhizobium sp. SAFR-030 TaxID=3387277 RepID=UPI003F80A253
MADISLVEQTEAEIEIIPPTPSRGTETRICACCGKRKDSNQFDEDCCGICEECLYA